MTGRPGATGPLRIVVADDQPSLPEALVIPLALPGIDAAGSAAKGEEAIRVAADTSRRDPAGPAHPVLDGIGAAARLARPKMTYPLALDLAAVEAALRVGSRGITASTGSDWRKFCTTDTKDALSVRRQ